MPYFTRANGTAVAGAATAHGEVGTITTEPLTTAAGATYTLTLNNSYMGPKSHVVASVANGTNAQGDPSLGTVAESEFGVVITVVNRHASQAFNGTLKIKYQSLGG